ncbi:hypothetical protein TNIN_16871 [Trichonephila inaurata madagascariensis]|uniref:Uncharacterized protein n=1 Tax=Trichonephila inaurata madagascariensis TaxID=2747483 RepID=A0A8X7CAK9_9ARAC|nr:hypothetical protein TNIN_16871 [Trichonephila inaurata madagascariensis]
MLDGLPRNSSILQTPSLDPPLRGETTGRQKSIVLPPSARSCIRFQHFSSHFGVLTCTLEASDEVEDVRDIQTHAQSLYGTQKGVSPVRERPLKLIAEVAYIKVAPVSGCVR